MNMRITIGKDNLDQARALVEHLEQDDVEAAGRVLDEITNVRESELFQEVGKLTREVHDTLNTFITDKRLSQVAEEGIPDARDRLDYVITLTDQAAHRTLTAVEECQPLAEKLDARANELGGAWSRFLQRDMNADDFRQMSREIREFFDLVAGDASQINGKLNDVLMAQEFQDLTGQIIRRVIGMVQDLENDLVRLIKIAGKLNEGDDAGADDDEKSLEGPPIPGRESDSTMASQDEVDELLSGLGF